MNFLYKYFAAILTALCCVETCVACTTPYDIQLNWSDNEDYWQMRPETVEIQEKDNTVYSVQMESDATKFEIASGALDIKFIEPDGYTVDPSELALSDTQPFGVTYTLDKVTITGTVLWDKTVVVTKPTLITLNDEQKAITNDKVTITLSAPLTYSASNPYTITPTNADGWTFEIKNLDIKTKTFDILAKYPVLQNTADATDQKNVEDASKTKTIEYVMMKDVEIVDFPVGSGCIINTGAHTLTTSSLFEVQPKSQPQQAAFVVNDGGTVNLVRVPLDKSYVAIPVFVERGGVLAIAGK